MKLAVCQMAAELTPGDDAWSALVARLDAITPDVFLLNELPFGLWISPGQQRDERLLRESQQAHAEGVARLADLGVETVLGTRAISDEGRSVNEAFVWSAENIQAVHHKQFFPNEAGYFEAKWFDRGRRKFQTAEAGGIKVGFLICTDVMFNEWARHYRRQRAHLIAVPRATPPGSLDRWRAAMSMAAIVSGCYVASSNRCGLDSAGYEYAGHGWIFDPFGKQIAETSDDEPIVSVEMNLDHVRRAQSEYPCYVEELPHSQQASK